MRIFFRGGGGRGLISWRTAPSLLEVRVFVWGRGGRWWVLGWLPSNQCNFAIQWEIAPWNCCLSVNRPFWFSASGVVNFIGLHSWPFFFSSVKIYDIPSLFFFLLIRLHPPPHLPPPPPPHSTLSCLLLHHKFINTHYNIYWLIELIKTKVPRTLNKLIHQ